MTKKIEPQKPKKPARILRLPEVKQTVGLSRSNIYGKLAEGTFPQPVKLGPRAVGWYESDIAEWVESLRSRQ